MRLEKKLDILGPLEQAARCLDLWLKEERRALDKDQRQRVAALMARYFHHEDDVTDALMLSFLRHYSAKGKGLVDMEDPASVRMEIKAVLDKSRAAPRVHHLVPGVVAALVIAALLAGQLALRKISRDEQAELKSLVHQIDALDPTMTSAAIWNSVKGPLQVRRYEDMTRWDYWRSRSMLETKLAQLTARHPGESRDPGPQ